VTYLPIEHHGVIGDLHTAALVGLDGTIDWLCLPYFDSPSIFASILDDRRGGFCRIAAVSPDARRRQMYLPDSNILLTRFLTPDGVGEIVDFMPVAGAGASATSWAPAGISTPNSRRISRRVLRRAVRAVAHAERRRWRAARWRWSWGSWPSRRRAATR